MINYFLSHFLLGAKFNADNIPSNRWSVGLGVFQIGAGW